MNIETIKRLADAKNSPCVSISLNTHRTHPACQQDAIQIKNLCKEAEERLLQEYNKREIQPLLDRLAAIPSEIDVRHNLESLHLFISNDLQEVIRTIWPVTENNVHISDSFSLRYLIKAYNRTTQYHILLLSQSGVQLFVAQNDEVLEEVNNEEFPISENQHYHTHHQKLSDSKAVDNMVREFLNKVDKALVRTYNINPLKTVVICTEDNYSRLMEVADRKEIYYGYAAINYNQTATHHIVKQAWELVAEHQKEERTKALDELKGAVSEGKVVTDLREIYRAAMEGRADLLISHNQFSQAVRMNGAQEFDLINDAKEAGAIDDITSNIAWEVIAKKGRVIFTEQEELNELGKIALKLRF